MTPEEIVKKRAEFEAIIEKRMKLIEASVAASNSGDKALANSLYKEMMALDPDYCEHGRSWASTCYTCEQIHMECYPENYGKCNFCEDFVVKDELTDGWCLDCYAEEATSPGK